METARKPKFTIRSTNSNPDGFPPLQTLLPMGWTTRDASNSTTRPPRSPSWRLLGRTTKLSQHQDANSMIASTKIYYDQAASRCIMERGRNLQARHCHHLCHARRRREKGSRPRLPC
ncbi:hypothetical protein Ae201684P_022407 [Aphanomyces euteiches]|nr:hypothetical protein Ae201684P_022407 [Aphanomyces euteiches]